MIVMTIIMILAFICAIIELFTKNVILAVLLFILACVCWAGQAVVDELKKQNERREELFSFIFEDIGKLKKSLKKKDDTDAPQ